VGRHRRAPPECTKVILIEQGQIAQRLFTQRDRVLFIACLGGYLRGRAIRGGLMMQTRNRQYNLQRSERLRTNNHINDG
jgi:hypothetical protein